MGVVDSSISNLSAVGTGISSIIGTISEAEARTKLENIVIGVLAGKSNVDRNFLKSAISAPVPGRLVLKSWWGKDQVREIIEAITKEFGITPTWDGGTIQVDYSPSQSKAALDALAKAKEKKAKKEEKAKAAAGQSAKASSKSNTKQKEKDKTAGVVDSISSPVEIISEEEARAKLENVIGWFHADITAPEPGRLLIKPLERNEERKIFRAINKVFGVTPTWNGGAIQVDYSPSQSKETLDALVNAKEAKAKQEEKTRAAARQSVQASSKSEEEPKEQSISEFSPSEIGEILVYCSGLGVTAKLKDVASITPYSKGLLIRPWDSNNVNAVLKALQNAFGVEPLSDSSCIYLDNPALKANASSKSDVESKEQSINEVSLSEIEEIMVYCYGGRSKLKDVAFISEQSKELVIVPWDSGIVSNIRRAIQEANICENPFIDSNSVFIDKSALKAKPSNRKVESKAQAISEYSPSEIGEILVNCSWGGLTAKLKDVASITPYSKGLLIRPWNSNNVRDVVKALQNALGVEPLSDISCIYLDNPALAATPSRGTARQEAKSSAIQGGNGSSWVDDLYGGKPKANGRTKANVESDTGKSKAQATRGVLGIDFEAMERASKSFMEGMKSLTGLKAIEEAMGKLEADAIATAEELCAKNALESWFRQFLKELPKEVWECDETSESSIAKSSQQTEETELSLLGELDDDFELDDSSVVISTSGLELEQFWPGKTAQYWIPSRQKPLCEMLSLLLQDNPDIQPSDRVPLLFHHGNPGDEPMVLDFSDEENPRLRPCDQSAEDELLRHEQSTDEKSGGIGEYKTDRRMLVVSSSVVPEKQLVVLLMGKPDIGLMRSLDELSWTLKALPCDNQRVVFWEEANTLTNMRVSPLLEKLAEEGRLHIVLCKEQMEIMPGDKHSAEEALPIMFQKQAETLCKSAWRHWLPDATDEKAAFVKQLFAIENEAGLALLQGIRPKAMEQASCKRFNVSKEELTGEMVLELKLAYLELLPSILSGRRESAKVANNPFPYNSRPAKNRSGANGLDNSAFRESWLKQKEKLGIALGKIVFRLYSDQKESLPDKEEVRQLFICFLARFSYQFAEIILAIFEAMMNRLLEVRNHYFGIYSQTITKSAILRFKPDFTAWVHKQFTCFDQRILNLQTLLCGKSNDAELGGEKKKTNSQRSGRRESAKAAYNPFPYN